MSLLRAFYFHDPRLDLVPAEHLATDGIDAGFAQTLGARPGWSAGHVSLLDRALALYWSRYDALASDCPHLSPPRLRNVGVLRTPGDVRPYCQILNESTTVLELGDLDPTTSNPEFVSFLLAMAERMAETGEVLLPAVHLAPWWFDRTDEECDAFTSAARASDRRDAATYRAIAEALPWLRELRHTRLRPPRRGDRGRAIPGTGLFVPRIHEPEPDRLVERIRASAAECLQRFYARQRTGGGGVLAELRRWLGEERPPLAIVGAGNVLLWSPRRPTDTARVEGLLRDCGSAVVESVREDLACIADHTRRFLAALSDPHALPPPDPDTAQDGYSFLHRDLALIAYDLDEPGIERTLGPGIPYARAMLGARTAHEWAHLAVDAGWVPRAVPEEEWATRRRRFARLLDELIEALDRGLRRTIASDLAALARTASSAGDALASLFERRLPDFQANLLAVRFQSDVEREAYVRQNVRPLRREYRPEQLLRMLVRYLYELQYLHFSAMPEPRIYFLESTWFDADFLDRGILDEDRLEALAEAGAALCHAHAVDESRFRNVSV